MHHRGTFICDIVRTSLDVFLLANTVYGRESESETDRVYSKAMDKLAAMEMAQKEREIDIDKMR